MVATRRSGLSLGCLSSRFQAAWLQSAWPEGLHEWLNELWNDALDIVFPRWCAGCGQWDEDLCKTCRAEFSQAWYRVEEHLPYLSHVSADGGADTSPFPVLALADYAGCVAKAIVRWKNVADRRLDWAFAGLVSSRESVEIPARAGRTVVVPAPSSPQRARGGRFVAGVIAEEVAEVLDAEYADVLVRRRMRRGRGLEARGRKARAVEIAAGMDLRGTDVVLVDDVVTTGATLAGASRAVKSAGGRVIAGFTLAATRDPRQMRGIGHIS